MAAKSSKPKQSRGPARREPSARQTQTPPPTTDTGVAAGRAQRWTLLLRGSDRRGRVARCVLALCGGVLWILALPPYALWPLAWLAPIPLFVLVEAAPSARHARRAGWLMGATTSFVGFFWVIELVTRYAELPTVVGVLLLLLLSAYQGVVFWLCAWALYALRSRSRQQSGHPLPMIVLGPIAIVTFEYLVPMIFPFNLGVSQAWVPSIIQIAELTGPVGVSALLFLVAGGAYDALTHPLARKRITHAGLSCGVLALALVYGHCRMASIADERARATSLTVGLVQSNTAFDGPAAGSRDYALRKLRELQQASADAEQAGAQLVVWSEAAFPFALSRPTLDAGASHPEIRRTLSSSGETTFRAPAVIGALTFGETGSHPYNSALYLHGDRLVARYDKTELVMFSEKIPFADTFPWLERALPSGTGRYSPGEATTMFALARDGEVYRLAPLICLEDTLPRLTTRLADSHPHLLVNITNDTWFGKAAEPWQHLALSVFRAVEMRTDLVRAVNSGVTAHIDATGQLRDHTQVIDPSATPRHAAALNVDVKLLEGGHGFFAQFGNVFAWLCILVWLTLAIVLRIAATRKK